MNVHWIVSNYPHTYDVQAGIFYKFLAENLVKEDIDLTIIAPVPYSNKFLSLFSDKWKNYALSPRHEEVNGVKIYRPRYLTHPNEATLGLPHYFIFKAIKKLKLPKPNLIHSFSGYPSAYAATNYAKYLNIPIVNTFIGSDVNDYPNKSKKCFSRFMYFTDKSDKILAVSKTLSTEIKRITGLESETLYLPVSDKIIPSITKLDARKKLSLPEDKFIMLFAGYISEGKGVNELIQSYRILQEDENILGIFCGGKTNLVDEINNLPNAKYLGQLPQEQVMNYMKAADGFILPSYSEGIGMVVVEAGMVGVPVIATAVGEISEILSEGRGILISPKNVEEIVTSIREVKLNYSDALKRAEMLKKYVKENFNVNKIIKKQVDIYMDVLKSFNKGAK